MVARAGRNAQGKRWKKGRECDMAGTEREKEELSLLSDIIDKEKLQRLQDTMAEALDMAFIAVDYRGRPVVEYSGFTDFCQRMRQGGCSRDLCFQCDAHGGLHATITGEPYIYRCHAGLVDFAVPLILDGQYLGSLLGGQLELTDQGHDLQPILPQNTQWKDDPALVEASKRVHRISYEKLKASILLVRDMMQGLLQDSRRSAVQANLERRIQELMEERAARANFQETVAGSQFGLIQDYLGGDFFFYVLNVLSCLAYREKAEETERAVCDFASMMRYVTENADSNFVPLGEELGYITSYLQLQKRRLEGRLQYDIHVPEKYYGVLCLFMMIQPMVENALRYAVEPSEEGGSISIRAHEEGELLVVTVSDNGTGMSREQIDAILRQRNGNRGKSRNYLTNINQRLKHIFGKGCGLVIRSKEDGFPGTEIQVRIPLRNEETLE